MKIKCNIADILHDAADKELAHNQETYWLCYDTKRGAGRERFSCCAIENAAQRFLDKNYQTLDLVSKDRIRGNIFDNIEQGLVAMGLNTSAPSVFGCEVSTINSEIQGYRYFWLKWAALMAEEQGAVYETNNI